MSTSTLLDATYNRRLLAIIDLVDGLTGERPSIGMTYGGQWYLSASGLDIKVGACLESATSFADDPIEATLAYAGRIGVALRDGTLRVNGKPLSHSQSPLLVAAAYRAAWPQVSDEEVARYLTTSLGADKRFSNNEARRLQEAHQTFLNLQVEA